MITRVAIRVGVRADTTPGRPRKLVTFFTGGAFGALPSAGFVGAGRLTFSGRAQNARRRPPVIRFTGPVTRLAVSTGDSLFIRAIVYLGPVAGAAIVVSRR